MKEKASSTAKDASEFIPRVGRLGLLVAFIMGNMNMNMSQEKRCFIIAPIGKPYSEIRKRSDQLFKHVIRHVSKECGYTPIRADQISESGIITHQIIVHIVEDPLVIADLTGHNANVFYELALRHATRKPVIQIIEKGQQIPFDVAAMRTVQIKLHDLDSVEDAKNEIINQIRAFEIGKNEMDTPISVTLDINILRQSKDSELRSLADIVKIMASRTEAIANLDFYEKVAVLERHKQVINKEGWEFIQRTRNDFRAVSSLKNWAEPKRTEDLIRSYIIPIIKGCLDKLQGLNFSQLRKYPLFPKIAVKDYVKALNEIIEIALEFNIESDTLKKLHKRLLSWYSHSEDILR